VGRGIGSGKGGHTAGRGTKGQKAREDVALTFEGTKVKKSFIKKTPFLRGRGKFKAWEQKAMVFNLKDLVGWPANKAVNLENLVKEGWVRRGVKRIKILGDGEINRALVVGVEVSKQAREKIGVAGGKIESHG